MFDVSVQFFQTYNVQNRKKEIIFKIDQLNIIFQNCMRMFNIK